MDKILALVEGQTEETFVRNVLEPHLFGFSKVIISTLVVTKRVKSGPHFKGGVSSYNQVRRDLTRLLRDTSAVKITTMLDFYALPTDFPGQSRRPREPDPYRKVRHLESAFANDIGDPRFIPYLSLHEFEALLFADPASALWIYEKQNIVDKLNAVRAAFQDQPELINENPTTAPSKRVAAAFPTYDKPLHGPLAVSAAGLPQLRALCPHFNEWTVALEK